MVERWTFRASRFAAVACVLMLATSAGSHAMGQTSPPRCSTLDRSSTPATRFAIGEQITIRGAGFRPASTVLVTLVQGTRTVELARVAANDVGAFATTDARVPTSVAAGEASVKALDARASATCRLTLSAPAKDEPDLGGLYLVWGSLLAIFGALLALFTYRRWRRDRLAAEIEELARREEARLPALQPALQATEDEEDERSAGSTRSRERRETSGQEPIDLGPLWEKGPAAKVRSVAPGPAAAPAKGAQDALDGDPAGQEEPQVLPVGWDTGRLRPRRDTSDAIERLRREVRTWRESG